MKSPTDPWYARIPFLSKRIMEHSLKRAGRLKLYGDSYPPLAELDTAQIQEFLRSLKSVSDKRESRLKDYSDMLADGVTLSAVELIAEDATQQDSGTCSTVWVTSDNKEFEQEINSFLKYNVDIESQAFVHAFNVVVYGECYLNTFASDEEYKRSDKVGNFFEVEPPQNVAHLYEFGKPFGYYVQDRVNERSSRSRSALYSEEIFSEADFIHFIADRGNREQITLLKPVDGGEEQEKRYIIRYGSSFLEAARTYYKTRMLLDDVLLLSRLSRSQYYRLFGIEVGAADTGETTKIIQEFKNSIQQRRNLDMQSDQMNTHASPVSTGGNIYYATRQGKGSTSVQAIGGEVDVKSILDIDYFDNKYYGALKVPKQFLGQSEDMPGGLGDTTLTRLDIRYSRTVKRVQNVLIAGYTDLILWYIKQTKKDGSQLPLFQVHMAKVSSADEDELAKRSEVELHRFESVMRLLQSMNVADRITPSTAHGLLRKLISETLGDKGMADLLVPQDEVWEDPPDLPEQFDDMSQDGFAPPYDMFGQ